MADTNTTTNTQPNTDSVRQSANSSQQAILNAHIIKQNNLLAERKQLEDELLRLDQKGTLTDKELARRDSINLRLNQIKLESDDLKKVDESISTLDADGATKAAAKEELVKKTKVEIPPPPPGLVNIIHTPNIAPGDLINYIKFTQHLNPYGRRRQCDIDLENILSVINKSVSNSQAEIKAAVGKVIKSTK